MRLFDRDRNGLESHPLENLIAGLQKLDVEIIAVSGMQKKQNLPWKR